MSLRHRLLIWLAGKRPVVMNMVFVGGRFEFPADARDGLIHHCWFGPSREHPNCRCSVVCARGE